MPDARAAKTLNLFSVPTAGLLLLFFFLPWVKVTCGTYTLAAASGYQLSKGEISPSGDLEKIAEQMPGATAESSNDEPKEVEARPWFWLGLAIPAIVLLLGGLGAAGKLSAGAGGGLFVALGVLGIALMVCAMMVDFQEEFKQQRPGGSSPPATESPPSDTPSPPSAEFGNLGMQEPEIETEPADFVWISAALYLVVAVFGVVILRSRRSG